MTKFTRLASLFMISAAALALSAPAHAAGEKIKAVASFSILGDMVSRIGGDHVEVTTLVGPNQDAHVFSPSPSDASRLADSRLFFVNGLGFEGWLSRLTEATGYKGKSVVVSEGIKPLAIKDDHEEHAENKDEHADHEEHADEHGHGDFDPHAWQDLSNGMVYATNIAKALCAEDAGNCNEYNSNADKFVAEMKALDAEIKASVAKIPADKRKVITTHDAFSYFGKAYGIEFFAPEGISTETEASAADIAKLGEQIKKEKITALFIETMSDPRLIEQMARDAGVKLGGELYSDALAPKGEEADTYLGMMRHNISLLAPAMAGS